MNTLQTKSNHPLLTWILAVVILVLAAAVAVTSALTSTAQGSQELKPTRLGQTPTVQAAPIQPDCQSLPECGYIRAHAINQDLLGSGPIGQENAPVLTPACDALPECRYIRAHLQADAGAQP
jgi:hypothetical protein